MHNLNSVFLSGRVVATPLVKEFDNGNKLTEIGIATHRSFKKGEEWVEKTTFVDCEAGGSVGERLAGCVEKGTLITISAVLDSDEWEQDGKKRSKVKLRINDFEINLPRYAKKDEQSGQGQNSTPQPAQSVRQIQTVARGFRGRNQGNQAEVATGLPF
jgi:single-strand DNA-binding protein